MRLRNFLLPILLMLAPMAQAQVTFVAADNNNASSNTSRTAPEPAGTADGDIVFLFCVIKQNDGTWTDPADFTEIDQQAWNEGDVYDTYLGYKIRGATAGDALTCTYSGTASPITATAATYRPTTGTIEFDVTFSAVNHATSVDANSGLGPCPDITTNQNGALVICFQYFTDDGAWTAGNATGFTLDYSLTTVANRATAIQSQIISTAGLVDPGNWGHTDVAAGVDEAMYVVSIREAAGGGGSLLTIRRRR